MLNAFRQHQRTVLLLLVIVVGGSMVLWGAGSAFFGRGRSGPGDLPSVEIFGKRFSGDEIRQFASRMAIFVSSRDQLTLPQVVQQMTLFVAARRAGVVVSEAEARSFLRDLLQQTASIEYVQASLSKFQDSEQAHGALQQMIALADDLAKKSPRTAFNEAAQQVGLDVKTADELRASNFSEVLPELASEPRLADFLFSAPAGKISPVFSAPEGPFVVRVLRRSSGFTSEGAFRQGQGWIDTNYGPQGPATFRELVKRNFGTDEHRLLQATQEHLTIAKFQQVIASDVDTPESVLYQYFLRNEEQAIADYHAYRVSEFLPAVSISREDVLRFYAQYRDLPPQEGSFGYRDPEKVEIEYVLADFESLKRKAREALTDEQLMNYYEANKEQFAAPVEEGSEPTPKPFEEMKEQIADRLASEDARRQMNSITEAAALAASLFAPDAHITTGAPSLRQVAERFGLQYVVPPPFSREEATRVPAIRPLLEAKDFLDEVFDKPAPAIEQPISRVFTTGEKRFFYHVVRRIEPQQKDFDELPPATQEKVENDLRRQRALGLARDRLNAYQQELAAAALNALADALRKEVVVTNLDAPPALTSEEPTAERDGEQETNQFLAFLATARPDFLVAPRRFGDVAFCGFYTTERTDAGATRRTARYLRIDLPELTLSATPTQDEIETEFILHRDDYSTPPLEEVKGRVRDAWRHDRMTAKATARLQDAAERIEQGTPMSECTEDDFVQYQRPAAFTPESAYDIEPLASTTGFVQTLGRLKTGQVSTVLQSAEAAYLVQLVSRSPESPESIVVEYLAAPYKAFEADVAEPTDDELAEFYSTRKDQFADSDEVVNERIRQALTAQYAEMSAFEKVGALFRQTTARIFKDYPQKNPMTLLVEWSPELRDATGYVEPDVRLPADLSHPDVARAIESLKPSELSEPVVIPRGSDASAVLVRLVEQAAPVPLAPEPELQPEEPAASQRGDGQGSVRATELRLQYVVLDGSKFTGPSPEISPEAIQQYYDAHKDEFRRDAQVEGEILYIPASAFHPLVEVSEEDIREYFEQHQDAYSDGFEQSKERISQLLRDKRAENLAAKALEQVRARALVEQKPLKEFARAGYLVHVETGYFPATALSFTQIGIASGLAKQAFALKVGEITQPMKAGLNRTLIFRKTNERPAGVSPLEDVESKVREALLGQIRAERAFAEAKRLRDLVLAKPEGADAFAAVIAETRFTTSQRIVPQYARTELFKRPTINPYLQFPQPYWSAAVSPLGDRMFNFVLSAFSIEPGQFTGPIQEDSDMDTCYLVRSAALRQPALEEFERSKARLPFMLERFHSIELSTLAMEEILSRGRAR